MFASTLFILGTSFALAAPAPSSNTLSSASQPVAGASPDPSSTAHPAASGAWETYWPSGPTAGWGAAGPDYVPPPDGYGNNLNGYNGPDRAWGAYWPGGPTAGWGAAGPDYTGPPGGNNAAGDIGPDSGWAAAWPSGPTQGWGAAGPNYTPPPSGNRPGRRDMGSSQNLESQKDGTPTGTWMTESPALPTSGWVSSGSSSSSTWEGHNDADMGHGHGHGDATDIGHNSHHGGYCKVADTHISLPANQTTLVQPSNQLVTIIALARGVQNYTCTNGTYVNIGALADLYGLNCPQAQVSAIGLPDAITHLPQLALNGIAYPAPDGTYIPIKHEFVQTANSIAPSFFTPTQRSTFSKAASLASPQGPENIVWLDLVAFLGQDALAKSVFRVFTVGGQPPAMCSADDAHTLSVPYAALYYFLA